MYRDFFISAYIKDGNGDKKSRVSINSRMNMEKIFLFFNFQAEA